MPVLERRRGDRLDQHVEERLQRLVQAVGVVDETGAARPRIAVDDRELDLLLVGVEVEEQLVHLVDDLVGACIRPVDLVDDEHDRKMRLERLAQDEPRLR